MSADGDAVGPLAAFRAKLPPAKEVKKVLPLGLMFFCILFSYTVLRDTKDVLVVTAPGSGAEIIPFLKTYVNLPGAIAFTALYSSLTNTYSRTTVFNGVVVSFISFFALFALVIYPNAALLHPTAFCAWLAGALPAGFAAPIAILRNWTYAIFYTMAELWSQALGSIPHHRCWAHLRTLTSRRDQTHNRCAPRRCLAVVRQGLGRRLAPLLGICQRGHLSGGGQKVLYGGEAQTHTARRAASAAVLLHSSTAAAR
jgi:hypothetical protein